MGARLLRVKDWEAVAREARFQPAAAAAKCSVSLRQFERFFAQNFHKPPGVWMRQVRCKIAKDLIAKGWTNKAVVKELGFGNDSHLCHEFQQFYGCAPQSYAPPQ